MLKHALRYSNDSTELFAKIADWEGAIWLDSGYPFSAQGRYDIMAARPFCTIRADAGHTYVQQDGHTQISSQNPFEVLQTHLSRFAKIPFELPFEGGAIGYFGYELGHRIEQFERTQTPADIPEMLVGLYDWAIVVDHQTQSTTLVSHQTQAQTKQDWPTLCEHLSQVRAREDSAFQVKGAPQSNMTQAQYADAFNAIQQFIRAGDCYQVNLAQRFRVQASGDAYAAYCLLRRLSPAPYMAYMNFATLQILSASPERFLQLRERQVETRPIKGTRPRGADAMSDAANAHELQSSLKDQAENLMIVDLLRNDLGKVCEVGSVRVSELFALHSFANVHHLISTVQGRLREDKDALDLLRACFPGGSITGAPKLRAMQIIEALEPDARGVYCGAIGYIGFDGHMDTNIPIRTAVYHAPYFDFWAGGGIVADSELAKEYKETWDKASALLKLVSQFPAQDSD